MKSKKTGCGCLPYIFLVAAVIFFVTQITRAGVFTPKTPAHEIQRAVPDNRFYYSQLNEAEKDIYAALFETVQNGGLKCGISGIDYDTYAASTNRAVLALTYDCPEFFWLSGGWESSGLRGVGSNADSITINLMPYAFWEYVSKPQKYIDTFETAVNAVVEKAKTYKTVYEQVEFVHDYIAHNTYYDYDRLEEAQKTVHLASSEYIYSAYGSLVDKAAVCAGYARAFQVVMQRLGYTCAYVRGDAGGAHAWNYVVLDEEGYFLDVTWDDADFRTDSGKVRFPNDAQYNYFCITKRELNKTHTEDETLFDVPNPTATKYNYYRYNGYYVTAYSFEKVQAVLDDQKDKSVVCVQFASLEQLNRAKSDLLDSGKWSRVPSLKGKKISYVLDKDHLSLTFLKE